MKFSSAAVFHLQTFPSQPVCKNLCEIRVFDNFRWAQTQVDGNIRPNILIEYISVHITKIEPAGIRVLTSVFLKYTQTNRLLK